MGHFLIAVGQVLPQHLCCLSMCIHLVLTKLLQPMNCLHKFSNSNAYIYIMRKAICHMQGNY